MLVDKQGEQSLYLVVDEDVCCVREVHGCIAVFYELREMDLEHLLDDLLQEGRS